MGTLSSVSELMESLRSQSENEDEHKFVCLVIVLHDCKAHVRQVGNLLSAARDFIISFDKNLSFVNQHWLVTQLSSHACCLYQLFPGKPCCRVTIEALPLVEKWTAIFLPMA